MFNDYVQGQVCESDADCYTKCRKTEPFGTGLCVLPWADPNMALAKCYKERMDSRVLGYLMRGKGDSRNPTTYALFEYLNSISEQQCLGPDARVSFHVLIFPCMPIDSDLHLCSLPTEDGFNVQMVARSLRRFQMKSVQKLVLITSYVKQKAL